MASTPKILGPDGILREDLVFSTNLPSRFFEGVMDSDTVDMQISVRGGPWTSDPDLILFEGSSFRVPNSSVFPDGLDLAGGENVILIRSISFSGAVSHSGSIKVTLLQDSDFGIESSPPTQFFVEQKLDFVTLTIRGSDSPYFRGINFYASRAQGGGSLGYQKINVKLVTDFSTEEVLSDLIEMEVDSTIALNSDGTVAADPLFLKISETQVNSPDVIERLEDVILTPTLAAGITEKEQKELLKTDFVKTFEVPETTRKLRTIYKVSSVVENKFFSFSHNRQYGPSNTPSTISIGNFASLPSSEPLYYVARAVYFDPQRFLEIESPNSIERVSKPVRIDKNVGTPPQSLTQSVIQKNLISSINRTKPELATIIGSSVRDVFVDPVSIPLTNMAFEADFTWRVQSFETLLPIDVDFTTGATIPVSQSAYKQSLKRVYGVRNDTETQAIVDSAFELLAFRFGKTRLPGIRSRGFVTFFTRNRPTSTVFIPLGTRVASGNLTFVTTSDGVMNVGDLASFFNPTTGVYSIDIPVRASFVGRESNVGPGQIRTIIDPLPGLSVTNTNAMFGGKPLETNYELSVRTNNALASVDSGTEQGVLAIAASQAGVEEVKVVSSGDPLMQRDLFEGAHLGGKVDIWVRGRSNATVTDTFAFTYEVANDVQFIILGNPKDLIFRSLDSNLSPSNPISSLLEDPLVGLGLRNATTGQYFNLTGYTLLNYRDVQLSDSVIQPVFGLGNIILGDYKYRTSTKFVLPRQPVSEISSVIGTVSGALDSEFFGLIRPKDPALEGNSVRAGDYLEVFGGVSGEEVSVSNESHTVIGEFQEPLFNLGANPLTVRVYNLDKTIEYRGPFDPSGVGDFSITPGTQTTPLTIQRTDFSEIKSGETVLIDYSHDENFTVTYVTNQVIPLFQEAEDKQTHLASDPLVKQALEVPLDLTATITFSQGLTKSVVQRNILANLQAFINSQNQGARMVPSRIVTTIQNTSGVTSVQLPLTKLARSEGTLVVRENILSDSVLLLGSTQYFPLSSSTVSVYLLTDALESATSDGGGSGDVFRGVYSDENLLNLRVSDPFQLRTSPGQSYIIGNDGLSIPGYSDDTTILAQFPDLSDSEVLQKRSELTGNRVMVSMEPSDRPELHSYSVTYKVAFVPSGVGTIQASSLEYFSLGNIILTLVEDK